jgi:hypothetical protein
MKLTVINNGQEVVEVKYVRVDGAERTAQINPGRAHLPADARIISSHPHIRVFDGNNVPVTPQAHQSAVVTHTPVSIEETAVKNDVELDLENIPEFNRKVDNLYQATGFQFAFVSCDMIDKNTPDLEAAKAMCQEWLNKWDIFA